MWGMVLGTESELEPSLQNSDLSLPSCLSRLRTCCCVCSLEVAVARRERKERKRERKKERKKGRKKKRKRRKGRKRGREREMEEREGRKEGGKKLQSLMHTKLHPILGIRQRRGRAGS